MTLGSSERRLIPFSLDSEVLLLVLRVVVLLSLDLVLDLLTFSMWASVKEMFTFKLSIWLSIVLSLFCSLS